MFGMHNMLFKGLCRQLLFFMQHSLPYGITDAATGKQ
jgi:hypothetical protein